MRRRSTIAGAGLLAACLAWWAALAAAQQALTLPPDDPPKADAPALTPPNAADADGPPAVLPPPPPDGPLAPATPTAAAAPAKPPAEPEPPLKGPVDPEGAAGPRESAVRLEWVGPPVAQVGHPTDYSLVVRNAGAAPVGQVVVRVQLPAGLRLAAAKPAPAGEGAPAWELGTLAPREERRLALQLVADAKGDVAPQASATFTAAAALRLRVREPKLALKVTAPDKVLVGDQAAFTLTVSNPGDGPADHVKVHARLGDGLEHARGNQLTFDLGPLAAGASRNVTLLCAARAGGAQPCAATAEAEGGLTARDSGAAHVLVPRLELKVIGPGLRYLERKALYTLRVTNAGDAPATNVTVADVVPAEFRVLAASDGGRHDAQTRAVSWFLGELAPGQSREVRMEVQAVGPGEHTHRATAVGARGLKADAALATRVEGRAALQVEVAVLENPIEVGADTAYEVRITNTGSKAEADIKLVATVPDQMQLEDAKGPARHRAEGKAVVFEPIAELAPQAHVTFRLHVKALQPGTVPFKVQVTSASLTDPVLRTEPTCIYADAPGP